MATDLCVLAELDNLLERLHPRLGFGLVLLPVGVAPSAELAPVFFFPCVQDQTRRGFVVAARPPGFLCEGFHSAREAVVDHEARRGHINPHAEGGGRADDVERGLDRVFVAVGQDRGICRRQAQETRLYRRPQFRLKSGVVCLRPDPGCGQLGGERVGGDT